MSDSGPGPYCSDGNHCAQRERITELEAKLKAANEKISALMDTRRSYTQPPMRAVSMTECIVSIEALELLAQEGGDNE